MFDYPKRILLRIGLTILITLWIIGFISPILPIGFLHSIYPFTKLIYSTTCHQNQIKSFSCDGISFLVCARCTGIYLGAFVVSLLVNFCINILKLHFKHFIIFSLPMLIDVISYSIGIYEYNKIIAASTGFLFGSTIFLYILSNVEFLLIKNKTLYDLK